MHKINLIEIWVFNWWRNKEVKKLLEEKFSKEIQEQLDEVMQFAGILNGETKNMTSKEIKASKRAKYYDE